MPSFFGTQSVTSESTGGKWSSISQCYQNWNATYYDSNGRSCGSSESTGGKWSSILQCYQNWNASYSWSKPSPQVYVPPSKVYTIPARSASPPIPPVETQDRILIEEQEPPRKPSFEGLKRYYLSQAGFFNASSRIFNGADRYNENGLNRTIQKLKDRAEGNPGGASDKTLKHFNLEKQNQEMCQVATNARELERYYLSQASFFNASSRIFNENDRYTDRGLNRTIQRLKNRAEGNPGGASDKTLKRFNLEKQNQEMYQATTCTPL